MEHENHHDHHTNGRHEHHGKSSIGLFDDDSILMKIGLKNGQTFLDGGCADGHFSIAASRLVGDGGRIHSFDVHKPSLDSLRSEITLKGISNIDVHDHDLREKLPLDNLSIDHLFLSNVLHGFAYNKELDVVIFNLIKVLRKDGSLTLIEWDKDNVSRGPPKDHRLSFIEIRDLLEPYGFTSILKENVGSEHVLMSFKMV